MVRLGKLLFIVLTASIGLPLIGSAQQVAPVIPVEPQRVEAFKPQAPVQMRIEDAHKLIEQLGLPSAPAAPAAAPQRLKSESRPGVSRTIDVPAPAVVNHSSQFQFRDVTERSDTLPATSTDQRRAAVEAYRQSLATRKGAGR